MINSQLKTSSFLWVPLATADQIDSPIIGKSFECENRANPMCKTKQARILILAVITAFSSPQIYNSTVSAKSLAINTATSNRTNQPADSRNAKNESRIDSNAVSNLLQTADHLIAENNPNAATELYLQILKNFPNNKNALDGLKHTWQCAVERNPLDPLNQIGLGESLQLEGALNEARMAYLNAVAFSPAHHNVMAETLLDRLSTRQANANLAVETFMIPSLGPFQNDADLSNYLSSIRKDAERRVMLGPEAHSYSVTVGFIVHHDGTKSDIKLLNSCDITEAELAAMNVARNLSVFPLPRACGEQIQIALTFRYDHALTVFAEVKHGKAVPSRSN